MISEPKVSVVIGSYNRKNFLKLTLQSLRKEIARCDFLCEIIVVDGGSTDGSIKWLVKQKDVILILQHNRGKWKKNKLTRQSWGYFMNLAFKCAKGKYICMLSDDCIVVPDAIKNGYHLFEKSLNNNEKIGGIAFWWRNFPIEKEYIVGITLGGKVFINHGMYSNDVLKQIDYIDEDTYSFYHADTDLALKIWKAGYKIIYSPDSYIEHYQHANVKVKDGNYVKQKKDWENYLYKWKDIYSYEDELKSGGKYTKEFNDPSKSGNKFLFYHYLSKDFLFHNFKMFIIGILKELGINYKKFSKNK